MTSQYLNETFDITINLSNAFLLRDEKNRAEFIRCRFERKEIQKKRLEYKLPIISENRVFFYIEFETV